MTTPRTVGSAAELLQDVGVDIENVQFYELHARIDGDVSSVGEDIEGEIVPSYNLLVRQDGDELGTRLATTLELTAGTVTVDAVINYRAKEPVLMDEAARLDFANNVALMALLPYVRQAVADLTQRVFGHVILMPIIQRGELSFSADDRQLPSSVEQHAGRPESE